MTTAMQTDVLVVGAGPVGLTLAMDLASRGVQVVVVEIRRYAEPPSVKCNHVAARTMEVFRRLGVGQKVRDAGLPPQHPNDVVFRSFCATPRRRNTSIVRAATWLHFTLGGSA